jgi:solute carrier family 25 (mitochondrial aspartate/glutamate transporter), member 12/13
MSEWAAFDNLLRKADAEYEIAFRFFDTAGKGRVTSKDIQTSYELYRNPNGLPFDFASDWASLYIGGAKHQHEMTYEEFAQMMRGLVGERIRQAFHHYDTDRDGYISPEEFEKLIRSVVSHKLSDHILENLTSICNLSKGSQISYANVRAFQNIVREMDYLRAIIRQATQSSSDYRIDRRQFLEAASRYTSFLQYTPMEADILFHFASIDTPSGRLALSDFEKVFDPSYRLPTQSQSTQAEQTALGQFFSGLLESAHHFALGSVAGAFGAFMVYPIDLVKTRMQNQRSTRPGERLYLNSIDCFQKVIKNEGFKGLYSGVLPQLVGVAPEKAIKLTVNDLVRGYFTDKKTGHIETKYEILSGGTAGACQVVCPPLLSFPSSRPLPFFHHHLPTQIHTNCGTGLHQPPRNSQNPPPSAR